MVEQADVFLSNLRSFELERFEVDYATLSRINPRIVFGNVNGYGKDGPDRDLPAYDTTAYWARAGIPYLLSYPGVPCLGYRPAIGDNVVALALAYGIMQALYVREKTGVGQEVDVSLFHTGLYQISYDVSAALITGMDLADWQDQPPVELQQQARAVIAQIMATYSGRATNPLTGVYLTKDLRSLVFVILQPDRYWERFCRAVGRDDLAENPRYRTLEGRAEDAAELRRIFTEAFLTKTLDEWRPLLDGIPHAPNQSLREAVEDPQARASDQLANPVMMSKTPSSVRMPAPEFGQHTEEVLLEFGFSWEDIARFKEESAIA
jgi:crotonobetainyl-CoA:carnitine CoA-transferase CaiB-like acyl-CoA transferase